MSVIDDLNLPLACTQDRQLFKRPKHPGVTEREYNRQRYLPKGAVARALKAGLLVLLSIGVSVAFLATVGCKPDEWVPYTVTCYSGEREIYKQSIYHLRDSWGVNRVEPHFNSDAPNVPTNATCVYEKA